MNYKHSCVIDADGYYKTIVLVHFEPGQPKRVLDIGDFGAAQITRCDVLSPMMNNAKRLIAAEYRSDGVYAGEMEDGRILYYMTGVEKPKTAVLIVDASLEVIASFAGDVAESGDDFRITDDETGGSIVFSLQEVPPEIVPVIQHYTIAEGERLIDTTLPSTRPHAGAMGLVRPRWDDDVSVWVEGARSLRRLQWEVNCNGKIVL